jgi:hypothetical protein
MFGRAILGLAVLGVAVVGLLALEVAPALAGPAACPGSAKAGFARVQLFNGANCAGGSMITVGRTEMPDFRAFINFDGKTYNVDNDRSSLAIAAGTCVRLYDAPNYGGDASTPICATSGTLYWNLARLDNRASSMRICTTSDQGACGPGAVAPPPTPTPTPPVGFDPDPTGFGGATKQELKANFYPKMLPLAKAVRAEFGVPVSFALAQAANESSYGRATFVTARNFYGIKCPIGPAKIAIGCTTGRTHEVFDGRRVKLAANFRQYRTVLDSMRDMGSLLKRKYPRAMAAAGDPNEFARQVHRGGYATDPDYARTIIAIMQVNDLYRYDR